MLYRSVTCFIITLTLFLFISSSGFVYGNWLAPPETSMSFTRWLPLFSYIFVLQLLVGYVVWWFLRRRQRPAEQTEVFHSIVHEFQTPITAIRMAADILDSPIAHGQPERKEKYVRIIREETERLQHQVETMLTLARSARNTFTLNLEPIRLHHLLHSIAERHGGYLRLNLSNGEPHILADRLHLTNVFYNLLDNAVKYRINVPDITLHTRLSKDGLTITVEDRGVGISPKAVAQIFQPFYRVDDRNQPSVKGFGLGLNYVQRVVQAHKWSIWVKSEEGKGSEFMIHIPPSSLFTAAVSDNQTSPMIS